MRWMLLLGVLLAGCKSEPVEERPPLLQAREGGELIFGHPQDDCAECHENHVVEWSISPHAYATRDPVFHAMSRLGQKATKGKLGQFCIQCHAPIALAMGTAEVYEEDGVFKQDTEELGRLGSTGVSCDVCHSMTAVLEPVNARAILTPNGTRRATIKDPVETPAHASEYSELHEEAEMCGMCHAVTNPKGAKLEETFPEWAGSSFAQPGGQTCQDCHMPTYMGRAAPDGPERELHRHTFVGVDVSLLPEDEFPGYQEMRDLAETLLKESATLSVTVDEPGKGVDIEIVNLAGHALPSGATAERQMWIEMIVRDAQGQVVFETGTLDENGDVRDPIEGHSTSPGSDPQLILFAQVITADPTVADPNSTAPVRVVTFPWEANALINTLVPVDGSAERRIDLSALPSGAYTASVRLLFRTFPMYFLKKLEEKADLDPAVKDRVPTVTMQERMLQFNL